MTKNPKSALKSHPKKPLTPPPTKSQARKGPYMLALPVKEPNVEAVRTFMLDCFVPILAKEFLLRRQAGGQQPSGSAVKFGETTTGFLREEGGL